MNNPVKWLTGTSVIGLLAVLSMYGKGAFEALAAVPQLIAAFSSGLPFGFKSFLLALALSALVFAFVERHSKRTGSFGSEALTLVVALAVTLLQQRFGPMPSGAPNALSAIWVGAFAGLAAPFVVRGMMAASEKPSKLLDD